ncbi:MAG TPA: hypothetical protein VFM02_00430 [Candidatus Paceibacterota bacterium]|nr:hypothetical protein [Candidatus Paceibacterota bacterium]
MSISRYLPKKKLPVIITVIVAVVVIGGALTLQQKGHWHGVSVQTDQATLAESTAASSSLDKDTDGDGLKDWQEILWGTDPKNPDTDGDGTPDGEEVKENRDPTIPGPNDQLQNSNGTPATSTAAIYASLTPQQQATRNLFARYLALQASGSLDSGSANDISNEFIQEALHGSSSEAFFKTYTAKDLIVSNDTSAQAVHDYGNKMGAIYVKYPPVSSTDNELSLFVKAENSKNQADFDKIKPFAERYRNVLAASLKVPVPKDAVAMDLNYINALSALATNADALSQAWEEPLQSGTIVSTYVHDKEPKVISAFMGINLYFQGRDITYTSDEPGALFSHFNIEANQS